MKPLQFRVHKSLKTLFLTLVVFAFQSISGPAYGCDLSNATSITYDRFAPGGPLLTIEVCIGGGVTGFTQGADGDTYDIAFGFYTADPAGVTLSSFSPAMMLSPATGCQMPGIDVGPVPGLPFDSDATVLYALDAMSFPACANGFECVSTTILCGAVHSTCITFQFQTNNVLLDSVRVFGVEGAGSPVAGCYPNNDMLIQFIPPFALNWEDWKVEVQDDQAAVSWSTFGEFEGEHFEIERSANRTDWHTVGYVDGKGSASADYEYVDRTFLGGRQYYRVAMHHSTGDIALSPVLEAIQQGPQALTLLNLHFAQETHQIKGILQRTSASGTTSLQVISMEGKTMWVDAFASSNQPVELNIDTETWAAGIYFVVVKEGVQVLRKKVLVY